MPSKAAESDNLPAFSDLSSLSGDGYYSYTEDVYEDMHLIKAEVTEDHQPFNDLLMADEELQSEFLGALNGHYNLFLVNESLHQLWECRQIEADWLSYATIRIQEQFAREDQKDFIGLDVYDVLSFLEKEPLPEMVEKFTQQLDVTSYSMIGIPVTGRFGGHYSQLIVFVDSREGVRALHVDSYPVSRREYLNGSPARRILRRMDTFGVFGSTARRREHLRQEEEDSSVSEQSDSDTSDEPPPTTKKKKKGFFRRSTRGGGRGLGLRKKGKKSKKATSTSESMSNEQSSSAGGDSSDAENDGGAASAVGLDALSTESEDDDDMEEVDEDSESTEESSIEGKIVLESMPKMTAQRRGGANCGFFLLLERMLIYELGHRYGGAKLQKAFLKNIKRLSRERAATAREELRIDIGAQYARWLSRRRKKTFKAAPATTFTGVLAPLRRKLSFPPRRAHHLAYRRRTRRDDTATTADTTELESSDASISPSSARSRESGRSEVDKDSNQEGDSDSDSNEKGGKKSNKKKRSSKRSNSKKESNQNDGNSNNRESNSNREGNKKSDNKKSNNKKSDSKKGKKEARSDNDKKDNQKDTRKTNNKNNKNNKSNNKNNKSSNKNNKSSNKNNKSSNKSSNKSEAKEGYDSDDEAAMSDTRKGKQKAAAGQKKRGLRGGKSKKKGSKKGSNYQEPSQRKSGKKKGQSS